MSNLLTDFQAKVDEISKYFEFVAFIDTYVMDSNRTLKTESLSDFTIDTNLEKVFKGNCYLMLYNLVEGSITESINAIFIDINQNNVLLHQLTPAYKQIWLKYKSDLVKSMDKKDMDKKHGNIDANLNEVLQNFDNFSVHAFTEKKKIGKNLTEEEIFEGYKAYLKVTILRCNRFCAFVSMNHLSFAQNLMRRSIKHLKFRVILTLELLETS